MNLELPWEKRDTTGFEQPLVTFPNVKVTCTYHTLPPQECLFCPKNEECSIPVILKLLQELLDVHIRVEKCGMIGGK